VVSVALDGTVIATTTADGNGDWSTTVTVPSSATPGEADLTASCGTQSVTMTLVLSASASLPTTGADGVDRTLAIATGLVVIGLALSGSAGRAIRRARS
jgi:hypothetical protein